MKKKGRTLRIVLFLGAISLLGIVVTQLFWVRNALWLQEKQCNHRVMLAMKSISNTVVSHGDGDQYILEPFRENPGDSLDLSMLDPVALDSIIMEEFS